MTLDEWMDTAGVDVSAVGIGWFLYDGRSVKRRRPSCQSLTTPSNLTQIRRLMQTALMLVFEHLERGVKQRKFTLKPRPHPRVARGPERDQVYRSESY